MIFLVFFPRFSFQLSPPLRAQVENANKQPLAFTMSTSTNGLMVCTEIRSKTDMKSVI